MAGMLGCPRQRWDSEASRQAGDEGAGKLRLVAMELELSRACNFRCLYCPFDERPAPEKELSEGEVRDIVLQAKGLGARRIVLVGGEPMLHRDILEVIGSIRSQDLEVEIFTNGSGITAEIARWLFAEGVRVVLKMDALAPSTQDRLTGRQGSFGLIRDAFRELRAAGYPSDKGSLAVETVICRQNVDELAGLWRWLRDQDIAPYFQIPLPRGEAREKEGLHVEPRRLEELFAELSEIDRKAYARSWDPQPPFPGSRCLGHPSCCRVCSQGDIVACLGLDLRIGSIREQKLREILTDSEILEDLRDPARTLKGPCRSCERSEECSGCRGAAYRLTGDYLASDPLCWKNAERQDEIARLPFPAVEIIPQGWPMRLVDTLVSVGDRCGEVSTTVSDQMPFARDDGTLEEVAYFEMMAQSIAALGGFKGMEGSESPAGGYLVGAHKLEILGAARVGDGLHIFVEKSGRFGKFGIVRATVLRSSTVLARGEIRIWQDGPGGGELTPEGGR